MLTKNFHKTHKYSGFTLAEVLLTLTIIGIVAMSTIPNLVQDIQTQQYKIAWKKNFSNLNQAMIYLVEDNGGSIANRFIDANTLRDLFLTRLSAIKKCDTFTAYPNPCITWPMAYLNGTIGGNSPTNDQSCAVLSNGVLISVTFRSADCTNGVAVANNCGRITIDTNGFKNPNIIGKDIYTIYITKDRIIPSGSQLDLTGAHNPNTSCIEGSTAAGNTGDGCATKYLTQ